MFLLIDTKDPMAHVIAVDNLTEAVVNRYLAGAIEIVDPAHQQKFIGDWDHPEWAPLLTPVSPGYLP